MNFKQVIIWGYPLYSHTHSFIMAHFKKGFDALGYKTKWLTDKDNIDGINFDGSLFFAAGEEEKKIPLNKSSCYVLHNTNSRKYIEAGCKVLNIQTHTIGTPKDPDCEVLNKWTVIKKGDISCVYLAWATDLLPHEIDTNNITLNNNKECVWVGTAGGGDSKFENGSILYPYFEEMKKNGIKTKIIDPWSKPVSPEENRQLVYNSFVSPALQGPWQVNNKYIPCRIFKNMSYGSIGITNNKYVNEIFDNMLVYDDDPVILAKKSIEKKKDPKSIDELKYLMNEVRTKHTYINRIKVILDQIKEL